MPEAPHSSNPESKNDSQTPVVHVRRHSDEQLDKEIAKDHVEVRQFARPSAGIEVHPPNEKRIQRSMLTLVMSVLLILCGSGGILAEIFHTSQTFQKGRADYGSEANKGTAQAIGEYWKTISGAVQDSEQGIVAAKNKAIQIEITAKAEVEKLLQQAQVESASTMQLGEMQRQQGAQEVGPYFNLIRSAMLSIENRTQEAVGTGAEIELLVEKREQSGRLRETFIQVPWNSTEDDSIQSLKCFMVRGSTASSCRPRIDDYALTAREFASGGDEPTQLSLSASDMNKYRPQLVTYRRQLNDLENALFYNALDLSRFKSENPNGNDRHFEDELSRVIVGLENVRRRVYELDSIQNLMNRSAVNESLPLAALGFFSSAPSATSIAEWLSRVPLFMEAARSDKEKEIQARSTEFYQSKRPLLANVWATWTLGRIAPLVVLGLRSPQVNLPATASALPYDSKVPRENWHPKESGLPSRGTVVIAMTIALGLLVGSWFIFRRFPQYGRFALFAMIPFTLLTLAFPVQEAFTINQSSEKLSLNLVSQVMPQHLTDEYTQRGAEAARLIRVDGTDRATLIVESAQAIANQAIKRAETEATAMKQVANVEGARRFSIMSSQGYDQLKPSCEALPSDVRAKCRELIDYASASLKTSWDRRGGVHRSRPPGNSN